MVKVTSLIVKAGSGLRFSFGVRAWTEMEIRYVEGMHRIKLVSCENNSRFKGLPKIEFLPLDWIYHSILDYGIVYSKIHTTLNIREATIEQVKLFISLVHTVFKCP